MKQSPGELQPGSSLLRTRPSVFKWGSRANTSLKWMLLKGINEIGCGCLNLRHRSGSADPSGHQPTGSILQSKQFYQLLLETPAHFKFPLFDHKYSIFPLFKYTV